MTQWTVVTMCKVRLLPGCKVSARVPQSIGGDHMTEEGEGSKLNQKKKIRSLGF